MGFLIWFVICLVIGMILAFILAPFIVMGQSRAKKEARLILTEGKIVDTNKVDRVMKVLSGMEKDLEAKDLWQKLQNLKDKQGII